MSNPEDFLVPTGSGVGWDANQTVPVLRPPRESLNPEQSAESLPVAQTSSNSSHGGGDSRPQSRKFPLSVDAKEFVPRSVSTAPAYVPPEISPVNMYNQMSHSSIERHVALPQASYYPRSKLSAQSRLSKYQMTNGTDASSQGSTGYEQSVVDPSNYTSVVVKRLHEFMQEITVKPGRFDALGRMFVDESSSWLGYREVVSAVIDAVIFQAIVERNFQYNGARLCNLLSSECGLSVFNQQLLERVQNEYERLLPVVESQPGRVFGFVGFLAELYTQMGADGDLYVLGEFLLNILDALASADTVDNIKRVCQYLKLTGRMLDKENKPKVDGLMIKLGIAGYRTNTCHIVSSVMSLRAQRWGEECDGSETAISTSDSFSLAGQPCLQSEAIQYGPDGVALSKEESDFLQASSQGVDGAEAEEADDFGDEYEPLEDEMDEEIEKGFIEFLRESKQLS